MKEIAAYLLALLGGNPNPSANDVKHILASVGADVDDSKMELLLSQVKGKDMNELIAAGRERMASIPSAGAVVSSPCVDAGAPADSPAAAEAKVEEKIEEQSDEDMCFSLFD